MFDVIDTRDSFVIDTSDSFVIDQDKPEHGLSQRERDEERARILRSKANSGKNLTRWERNQLRKIEENERLRRRIERQERTSAKTVCGKLSKLLKPFKFVLGFILLPISLLIMASILVTRYLSIKNR